MKEETFELIVREGIPIIHRRHGSGYVVVGRALTEDDGHKIVETMNRLTGELNDRKKALRDDLLRDVTDAIETSFQDVD